MKKIFFLLLLTPVFVLAQSTDQNFTKVITYKDTVAINFNDSLDVNDPFDVNDPSKVIQQVVYYDGLGRPIQQIAHKQSSDGENIVTHMEYDIYGRQIKEFLPYVNKSTSINYNSNAAIDVLNFYGASDYENTSNPYSEKLLENSPLSRVFKQAAPGNAWALSPSGSDKSIKFEYDTNDEEEVKRFGVSLLFNTSTQVYNPTLDNSEGTTFYAPNELYKTVTKDENWISGLNNTTEEFKDKEGKVILKRTFNNGEAHETYYVYDVYGNLTYVIPPLVNGSVDSNDLNGLCYQYKYDYRNRLVEKKLPGKCWEFIVYDRLDRVVATGPAINPFGGEDTDTGWLITKYDAFNRVLYTGWFNEIPVSAVDRKEMNSQYLLSFLNEEQIEDSEIFVDNYSISHTNKVFPGPFYDYKLLTVNYYDNYNYFNGPTVPNNVCGGLQSVYFNNTVHPKGLVTGTWSRILADPNEHHWEKSYTLYDAKSRPVRTHVLNKYTGGYTQVDSQIDFSGKTLFTETRHKYNENSTEIVIEDIFQYTPQDRLLLHKQLINGQDPQLIVKNNYDPLGQLTRKNVGGTDTSGNTGIQKVDYAYNVRGWLKSINHVETDNNESLIMEPDDLFGFRISYNTIEGETISGVKELYNGNISETFWKSSSDNKTRKYSYKYDDLNRLLYATYQRPDGGVKVPRSYDESINYDKNGNIINLGRNGDRDSDQDYTLYQNIDDLTYFYDDPENPNRLTKVIDESSNFLGFKDDSNGLTDPESDYEYDVFGNMTKDDNKKITKIVYNHLNLPVRIEFLSGNIISYIYNASGGKFQKNIEDYLSGYGGITEYLSGGFQYKSGRLVFFPHPEGYVNVIDDLENYKFNYVFNYTDHLGNIRLSYSIDPSTQMLKIIEENHYYPFGLKHTNYNSDPLLFQKVSGEEGGIALRRPGPTTPPEPLYKYKFQGQERQDELGLNWDSFKYRNYDYAIGRFMNIDPLAQDYVYNSPYAFAENRVMDGRELEGLEWSSSTSSDGKTVNLNLNARLVNNSAGTITNDQMKTLANERVAELKSSIGGTDSQGRTVNVSVNYSDKATMIWEYNNSIDTSTTVPDGRSKAEIDKEASVASGWTDEIGNTQVNRTQVNLSLPMQGAWDDKGQLKYGDKNVRSTLARTGAHEDGHGLGGRHETDKKLAGALKAIQAVVNSLMNTGAPGNNVSKEQRTEFVKKVEEQQ